MKLLTVMIDNKRQGNNHSSDKPQKSK